MAAYKKVYLVVKKQIKNNCFFYLNKLAFHVTVRNTWNNYQTCCWIKSYKKFSFCPKKSFFKLKNVILENSFNVKKVSFQKWITKEKNKKLLKSWKICLLFSSIYYYFLLKFTSLFTIGEIHCAPGLSAAARTAANPKNIEPLITVATKVNPIPNPAHYHPQVAQYHQATLRTDSSAPKLPMRRFEEIHQTRGFTSMLRLTPKKDPYRSEDELKQWYQDGLYLSDEAKQKRFAKLPESNHAYVERLADIRVATYASKLAQDNAQVQRTKYEMYASQVPASPSRLEYQSKHKDQTTCGAMLQESCSQPIKESPQAVTAVDSKKQTVTHRVIWKPGDILAWGVKIFTGGE